MSRSLSLTGLRWLWLSAVTLVIDLGSKFLIVDNFYFKEKMPLFSSINLCYERNYGAAFGFLASSKNGWQHWFLTGIVISACIVLLILMYRSKSSQKINSISYSLIFGGALGNLFDRLWHGFVVDMIDFYIGNWHFPTFNFADSIICVGIILISIEEFYRDRENSYI